MIALGGKNTIYASQEYDPVTTPVLSVMFTAVNDEIYPWQLFINQNAPVMAKGPETGEGRPDETESDEQKEPQANSESTGSYDTDKTGGTDRKENRGESGKANEQGENNGKNDDIKDQGINSGESGKTNEQTGENADAPSGSVRPQRSDPRASRDGRALPSMRRLWEHHDRHRAEHAPSLRPLHRRVCRPVR